MNVDFSIDELKHIRDAVNQTVTYLPNGVNTINNKIDRILDKMQYNTPVYFTKLGSSRKPVA